MAGCVRLFRAGLATSGVLVAAPSSAQPTDVAGQASLEITARELQSPGRFELDGQLTVGTSLRGVVAPAELPLGYAAGFDYQLGAGIPWSFSFDANAYPLGLGVLFGTDAGFAVLVGGGGSGSPSALPSAGQWVSEARLAADLPGALRGMLWLRAAWLGGERADGAPSSTLSDELLGGLTLRIGDEGTHGRARYGSGWMLGVLYIERGGGRGIGASVGHELDAAL